MIGHVDPLIVVPQGNEALMALARIEPHGLVLKRDVAKAHPWFGRHVFPLYHTSRLARVTRREGQQVEDYRALRAALDRLS